VEADRGEEAGTRTSELVHLTAATVSMDSSGVRGDNSRGRRSVSWRRRKNRTARQQRMLLSAVESLHSVEHESSQLIVVSGRLDGRRCRDILVDPGASSNFVRRDWALSQRLSVQQLKTPLDVTLADTRKVSQVTGCVAVRSAETQGSTAPCKLIVMDQLSHHVILGKPWLERAGVTLDFGRKRWNDRPLLRMAMRSDRLPQLHAIKVAAEHEKTMEALLSKYQKVFSKDLPRRSAAEVRNAISCTVKLKDPACRPVVSRERRRSPKDVQTLIDAVREMEAAGLIEKSDSPWSSQAVLVRKVREGIVLDEKRPCWDYRGANDCIVSDAFPLPLPEDMFDKLQGSMLFSKLDLTKGFWQIPVDPATRKILAMATPLGLYEPRFMPFGMKNAPAVFQREMQRVLGERLYQGVMVFIDDILIYSRTAEEHAETVEWVLRRLQQEGYYANPDKCEFFQREVSFLGHVISEHGVAVQQHKVRAVSEWPLPRTKKDVRAFLGLTGYYRKFIHCYSEIATPLTDLTKDSVIFQWTEREHGAFELLQLSLTSADVLVHPDPARQYFVTTDASGFAISGVLSQDQPDGSRRPVAYMSRKMNSAERLYPVHDKELLAIVKAVEHWRCYLEGNPHPVLLLSDHRSLQHINSQPMLNDRQARWVEKLSDFDFAVSYVPGHANVVADALSRRADYEEAAVAGRAEAESVIEAAPRVKITQAAPQKLAERKADTEASPRVEIRLAAAQEAVNAATLWQTRIAEMPLREEMKAAAQRDDVYRERLNKPEPRFDGLIVGDGLLWTCDGLFYVPDDRDLQRRLLHEVHDAPIGGHMGLAKTIARLTSSCWWPGMKSMIADYVRGCTTCAAVKPLMQKPAGLLRPLPIAEKPWKTITMDFVGPMPRTPDFFNYILVVGDKFTKRGHFIPTTTNVTAKETAELLLQHIVRLHGLPEAIISDRGHEFTAHLFQEVWGAMGTELRMSTAYHPQSDGQTERLNRELEQQLRAHANRTGNNWKERLAVVEMHYNSTVHASTGKTPFEMDGVDWRDQWALAMRSPLPSLSSDGASDLLRDIRTTWEDARQVMLKQREQQKKYADQRRRDEKYEVGDLVMLSTEKLAVGKGKLSDRWVGPFPVIEVRDNGVNVKLELPQEYNRIHDVFHVEKLKRFVPSAIDWPGRAQPRRPKAKLVDGRRRWWALRIVGKKEEERVETVREPIADRDEEEEKETNPPPDNVIIPTLPGPRRVSPRLHAGTRSEALPPPRPPRGKKAKERVVEVKKLVVLYQVEWEGGETTWEPADSLLEQDLQWMIDDYEMRQREMNGDLDLGAQFNFTATAPINGMVSLLCMRV
jgi:hypothetical protein